MLTTYCHAEYKYPVCNFAQPDVFVAPVHFILPLLSLSLSPSLFLCFSMAYCHFLDVCDCVSWQMQSTEKCYTTDKDVPNTTQQNTLRNAHVLFYV